MNSRHGIGKSLDWDDEFRQQLYDEIMENRRTKRRNLSDIGREFGINPANVYHITTRKWFKDKEREEEQK